MPNALFNPAPGFDFWVTMWEVQGPDYFGDLLPGAAGSAIAGVASALVSVGSSFLFGTFSEINGLDSRIELEDYQQGGDNATPRRFFQHGSYPELVLKRGMTFDTSIADWYYQVKAGARARIRKDGIVLLMDRGGPNVTGLGLPGLDRVPVAGWIFHRAIPKRIVGPTLNAKGNEIAIETLELAHEGLDRLSPSLIPGFADFSAALGGAISIAGSAAIGATGLTAGLSI